MRGNGGRQMLKVNRSIKFGYIMAALIFLLSIYFRMVSPEKETSEWLLAMGGFLLLVTSIIKIMLDKKVKG